MGKIGRPVSKNPRKKIVVCRLTEKENARLEDICKSRGMNTADTIRLALETLYKEDKEN